MFPTYIEGQFKFPRQHDGFLQWTLRMEIRLHQSWIGVTKHFQQDEGVFYPHTICLSFNRFHIVTVVSRERTHMDLEDPNGVSKEDIGLPTSLTEFQT